MPAQWNLPTTTGTYTVEDVERFNKLPFFAARQQTMQLPYYARWGNLFPTRKWEFNKGDVMLGIVEEFSPIRSQVAKPKYITSTPLKNMVSTFERTNTGRIYRHKHESPLIGFLGSIRDIIENKMKFRIKDLNRQIAIFNDEFIRWQAFQLAPAAYVVGAASPYVDGLPVGPPGEGTLTDPKDTSTLQSLCALIGSDGFLSFKNILAVRSYARNVIGIVPWDGVPGTPADNSVMGGRFLLMGEAPIYEDLAYDEGVLNIRPLEMNLVNKGFRGLISDNIVFREERYPIRIAEDGTLPAQEVEKEYPVNGTITSGSSSITNPGGAERRVEVVPNPAYVNAPFGVAFWIGYEAIETIEIGPPPGEFTSAKLDAARVGSLNWNGEVRMTTNVLVNYGGSSGLSIDTMDTNKYGEFVQLFADTVMGVIPKTQRFILPIFYRRRIAASLSSPL